MTSDATDDVQARFPVGATFEAHQTFTVAGIIAFAQAAGDLNPIHHDARYAAETSFGRIIASGTHTIAVVLGVAATWFSARGAALGVRFDTELLRPVYADEAMRIMWRIVSIEPHRKHSHMVGVAGQLVGDDGRVRLRVAGRVLVKPAL